MPAAETSPASQNGYFLTRRKQLHVECSRFFCDSPEGYGRVVFCVAQPVALPAMRALEQCARQRPDWCIRYHLAAPPTFPKAAMRV
jgi:hypothetical protein